VRSRRTRAAACIAVAGVVLPLAPLGASWAGAKPSPSSATCKAITREEAGATAGGSAIEKALASGNFGAARRQMLKAYNTELSNVNRAVAVTKSAPPNVRAAFKNLRTYVQRIRNEIRNAASLEQLVSKLRALGGDPHLQADGVVIADWAASVCGTPVPSTPSSG